MPFEHVAHGLSLPSLDCDTRDTGRVYWQPSEPTILYPSITTVLSIANKEGLELWKKRVGAEEAEKISKFAADRGTAVHSIAEDYINNLETWNKDRNPAHLQLFGPIKRILDRRVTNVWFQESQLFSRRLKTAGRNDVIAEFDGKLSIIDFKTSSRPKRADYIHSYFMQEAFYAAAFFELTGVKINQLVTIIAVDDALPQVFIERPMNWLKQFMGIRDEYRKLKGL